MLNLWLVHGMSMWLDFPKCICQINYEIKVMHWDFFHWHPGNSGYQVPVIEILEGTKYILLAGAAELAAIQDHLQSAIIHKCTVWFVKNSVCGGGVSLHIESAPGSCGRLVIHIIALAVMHKREKWKERKECNNPNIQFCLFLVFSSLHTVFFNLFSCYQQTAAILKYVRFFKCFSWFGNYTDTMCKELNKLLDLGNYSVI